MAQVHCDAYRVVVLRPLNGSIQAQPHEQSKETLEETELSAR
jgi:hypothetical protein